MGRFQYSIGQYASASDYLYHFRVLTTDADLESSAMWGKLVSDILEGAWDQAMGELEQLRKHIDNHYPWEARNSVVGLQQRTWWLHWSLFVFFNHPEGRDKLVDAWMGQQSVGGGLGSRGEQPTFVFAFLPTLQANCPWLLRYLVAAVIISRRAAFKGSVYVGANARIQTREQLGAALITAVRQERYQYSDPIVEFVRKLFLDLDFEGAAATLKEAEGVLANDFFLADYAAEFSERARWLYSEAYCRVHHRIDVGCARSPLVVLLSEA
jgi:translation initiation factor 3 subunit E